MDFVLNQPSHLQSKAIEISLTAGTKEYTLSQQTFLSGKKIVGVSFLPELTGKNGGTALDTTAETSGYLTLVDTESKEVCTDIPLRNCDPQRTPCRPFFFEASKVAFENSKLVFGDITGITTGMVCVLVIHYLPR